MPIDFFQIKKLLHGSGIVIEFLFKKRTLFDLFFIPHYGFNEKMFLIIKIL